MSDDKLIFLSYSSPIDQIFEGNKNYTIQMPSTCTLVKYQKWRFTNNSLGKLTIVTSGGFTITTVNSGCNITVQCEETYGSTATSWSIHL